jgi:hypothetical protein
MCGRRPGLVDLPEELMWTIMGFLDVPSLCSARLVCKGVCKAASGRVESLRLAFFDGIIAPGFSLKHFTGLKSVHVDTFNEHRLRVLAHPEIAAVATSIQLSWSYYWPTSSNTSSDSWLAATDLEHLELLPKLRAACVSVDGEVEEYYAGILPILPL